MPTDRRQPTVVHLVPHTHWDREWYEPFQSFRLRLVDLVDQLLARMEADSRMRFTLDGQCATVDDYLEVRPEAEGLIRRLVAEGRLAIGPWQILMDEFLVSGETMVRNLEMGWRRATELGGAMRVGYLPDMFGHVAQMPQMLRRAGIDRAVVWRGVPAAIDRNTFRWSAPDGSTVEAEYLVGGYGQGAYLFDVPDRFPAKLRDYVRTSAEYYGEHSVLAMYGTDHAVPTPRLLELVERANSELTDVVVRLETLAEYALRADGAPPSDDLPAWTGELRSGARANLLMNVASARMDIKLAAGRAERLLERYAEPLTALHGTVWPERQLELAWRRVVDNSAHDSICGCSHDAVGAQVLTRFAEAEQLARGIVSRTLAAVARHVPAGQWAALNPSPAARADLVELDVAVPPTWNAVEVQVNGRHLLTQEAGRNDPLVADLRLRGGQLLELLRRRRHGRELFQRQINGVEIESGDGDEDGVVRLLADDFPDPAELDVEELMSRVQAAVGERRDDLWRLLVVAKDRRRILARVPAPALGWAAIEVVEASEPGSDAGRAAVRTGPRSLDNGLVSVEVGDDGTFRLHGGGSRLEGVGRIVEGGDFGDSYNYGPPPGDRLVQKPDSVAVEVGAAGPLRGDLTIRRTYRWPAGVESDGSARTPEAVPTEVTMRLELRADEPIVRVHLAFENRSKDHRVRFHVPLGATASGSAAEGQFAVVQRGLEAEGGHGEVPVPAFPARGFVQTDGVTALLDHIVEYEVVDGRELAITLLRSFGLISRNENPWREDPAGPQLAVPASQLPGPWSIGFALMPHAGSWSEAGVVAAAEQYQHPFLTVRGTGPTPPEPVADAPPVEAANAGAAHGLEIEGEGVALTTLRRREEWLEVRVVAQTPTPVRATLRGRFDEAREADLLGRPGAPVSCESGSLTMELGAWEIRTVQVRTRDQSADDAARGDAAGA